MNELASRTSESFEQDALLAGSTDHLVEKKVIIVSGQTAVRGAVLGLIAGAAAAAVADAGNTGDGVFGAATVGAGVKPGAYRIVCIEPAADAGKFSVEDPDGVHVGVATVAVAFAGPINFTIADGAADFIAGDGFTVTVAVGTKYQLAASAAADGSAIPALVLAEAVDASGADAEGLAYAAGIFNETELTFGTGHTADTVRAALHDRGIYLRKGMA